MDKLGKAVFPFEPPKPHGVDAVECVKGMHRGEIQFFLGMGGNFVSGHVGHELHRPPRCRSAGSRRMCPSSSTARTSSRVDTALILPCLGRSEKDYQKSGLQFVTVEDSMGIVNSSRGSLGAAQQTCSRARWPSSAGWPARRLAEKHDRRLGSAWTDNYDLIRDKIEAVIPGFRAFQRTHQGEHLLFAQRPARPTASSTTASVRLNSSRLPTYPIIKLDKGAVRDDDASAATISSTRTSTGWTTVIAASTTGGTSSSCIRTTCARRACSRGQLVDLTSHHEGRDPHGAAFHGHAVRYSARLHRDVLPETNVLISINSTAERANTPASKFVVISVAPSPDADMAVNKIIAGARENTTHEPAAMTAS